MKLIRETSYDVEILEEAKDGEKNLYIEGIFMQADLKNGNGRIYPLPVLETATQKYRVEKIEKGSSWGELDHPESPTVLLKNASHRITSIRQEGSNFIGKALVLDTTHGRQVKGLLKGGGVLAVSTRGLGETIEENGLSIIQAGFNLCTTDIVSDPSAPSAFVKGILEGRDWYCDNGVFHAKQIDELRKEIKASPNPTNLKSVIENMTKFNIEIGGRK